jgi:hypothetical protein
MIPCKDCIFATYNGKTQDGCYLGMIERYNKAGIEVVEAYDDEKEFYVIKGACIRKVNKEVAGNITLEQAKKILDIQLTIQWQAIILADNTETSARLLESLFRQKIQPSHVTVIISKEIPATKIAKQFRQYPFKSWRVQTMEDKDLTRENAIDLVIDQYKIPFYVVLTPESEIEENFSTILNDVINNKLISFGIIEYPEKNIDIYSTYIHIAIGGNSLGTTFKEKLKLNKWDHKIYQLKQLS